MTAARTRPRPRTDPITVQELSQMHGDATDLVGERPFVWTIDPRLDRPNILAIDVGATTGWAILHASSGFMQKGSFKAGCVGPIFCFDLGYRFDELRRLQGLRLVVIEDVFLHSDPKKSNPQTMAHLAYYVGAVLHHCALHDHPAIRVKPSSWQSKLLGKIRRDQGKRLSVLRAQQEWKVPFTEHEADAALMGLYVRGPLL